MNKTRTKRLLKVSQHIDALPVAPAAEDAAFERFREDGELPEHERLASAVVDRALRGGAARQSYGSVYIATAAQLAQLNGDRCCSEPKPTPPRELLFREAIRGPEVIMFAAREVIKMLVAAGRDVTDPGFVDEDTQVPEHGSMGFHLLGFPECLAKTPYKRQAKRLFDRFAVLSEHVDEDDKRWFEDFDEAAFRFLHEGLLPDDELMREVVLANGEFVALLAHSLGEGNAGVMLAFDQAARAKGEAREVAIERVQLMAVEGRFVSSDTSR